MKKFFFLVFLLFVFADESSACSCDGTQLPCEAYWSASDVFLGTVTYSTTNTSKGGEHDFLSRVFRFTVEKTFRGVKTKEVEVLTGSGGGDCGYAFQLGGQYVVYAHRDETDRLVTSICSRTRPVSRAEVDLSYFRDMPKAEPAGTIFGEIKLERRTETKESYITPLKDVKLLLAGPGKQYEAITNDDGAYEVSGVLPGSYRVKVQLPEGTSIHQPELEIEVSERGCAQASFWLQPDTRVTGRIIDAQGHPASDVLMELVPVEPNGNRFPSYVRSNSEGRYEMKLVAPGRYLLGVRVAGSAGATYVPFPQTYYPGVKEQSAATVITITEGQHFEASDLVLPQRFVERQLSGIVVDVSGQPVRGATVWLKEMQYKDSDMPYRRETDQDGKFSFPVYEGLKYRLNAYLEQKHRPLIKSADLHVLISSNPETIKLVLR